MHRIRPVAARVTRRLLALLLILSPVSIETPTGLTVLLARSRRRGLVAIPSIAGAAPDEGGDDGGDRGGGGAGADGRGDGDETGRADAGDGAGADGKGGDGDEGGEPDWKKRARQLERDLKRERTAKADLARTLAEQDDARKTEHERALEAAKRTTADETRAELETERRAERLESRVIAAAARGVKVGEDTRRFEDPEDALLYLQRAIKNGDVDADELFDGDGKVDGVKLTAALADILRERPRLAADTNGSGAGRGSNDAGKGSAAAGSSLEGLTPQQIFERDQAARK